MSPLLTPPDARPALRVHGWDPEDPCDEEELVTLIGRAGWTGRDDVVDLVDDEAIAVDPFRGGWHGPCLTVPPKYLAGVGRR